MRVLFLPGGDGDASTFDGVLAHLPRVDAVVHDHRRAGDLPLAAHTDEVAATLTGAPAAVVATSTGALIGLDLLARYPDRVGLLVAHEPPAVDRLDAAALTPVADRIVAAGGERSGDAYPYRCALALAERFDLPFVLFPGGHTGYATHPRAFAETLLEVLLQA